MKNNYSLVNDYEPTEAQLKKLMHAVALEARQKAKETNKKLRDAIAQATSKAIQNKKDENTK